MSDHRQEFDNELEAIEGKVIELFAMVAEGVPVANQEMLLQAPVAADLRFLLSVLRIVPELERSHDLVVHIAAGASHLVEDDLTARARGLIARMGDLASEMWRQAADSWYQRDRAAAAALAERDESLDELHTSLVAELASGPTAIPVAMEMAQIARDYERLGAHAVNIARRVIYLAGSAAPPASSHE